MNGAFRTLSAFDHGNSALRTMLGGEELLLTWVSPPGDGGVLALTAQPSDAFGLVFQLSSLPPHVMWHDHHRVEIAAGPANAVTMVDLAAEVSAQIEGAFDSLHFKIPRAALEHFSVDAGNPISERLYQRGEAFSDVDPVIEGLSYALVGALGAVQTSPLFADHLSLSLLAHLAGRYGDDRKRASAAPGGLAPSQRRRSMAMLDARGGAAPTLVEVATACALSSTHCSRAFKLSVGRSPWAWHQARRIACAQVLLREGALPLAQIGVAAGFADQSHFTRAFTAHVGVPPGQWRRGRGCRALPQS